MKHLISKEHRRSLSLRAVRRRCLNDASQAVAAICQVHPVHQSEEGDVPSSFFGVYWRWLKARAAHLVSWQSSFPPPFPSANTYVFNTYILNMPVLANSVIRDPPIDTKRKPGRPPNVLHPQECMVMENIDEYRTLKAMNATQHQIGALVNKEARRVIRRYGWQDPLRAPAPQADVESDEGQIDEVEQVRRDVIYKKVRKVRYVTCQIQSRLRDVHTHSRK